MGSKFLRFFIVLAFLCFDVKNVFAVACTSAEINSCSSWKCTMAGRRYCQSHGCDQFGAEFCDSMCDGDRSTTVGDLSCSISADEKANDLCVTISGNKCTVTGMDFYNTECSYSGEVTCPTAPGGVNVVQVPCSVDANRKIGLECANAGSCPDPKGYNEALDSSPSSGCTWCEAGLKVAYNGSVYKCCNDGDTLPSGSNPNCSSFCPAGGFDIDVPLGQHNPSSASGDCACKSGLVTKYDGSDYMCCGPDQTMSGKACVCAAGYTKSGSSCISNCTVGSWTDTSEFEIQSEVCKMKQTRSACPSGTEERWVTATDQNSCCGVGYHWGGTSCILDCSDSGKGGFGQEDKCDGTCDATLLEYNNGGVCGCIQGYRGTGVGGTCSICPAGTHRLGWTSAGTLCPTCSEDHWSYAGSGSCTACPVGQKAPAGSTSPSACACPSDKPLWNGSACVACPEGEKYSDGVCWKVSDKDLTCFKDGSGNCDFGKDILDDSSLGVLYRYLLN
ncbi:MAG: hypothetical protein N4A44_04775 [Alphaproteobacteria bacterium]|jgi:hypothetical protein|nr:hypothetical protein [Alphaproteobacteria bacterium]